MATLTLSPEAKAKRLAKKIADEPLKGHAITLADIAKAEQNRAWAKQWLDSTFPQLFKKPEIPYEIGIAKRIKAMRPDGMTTSAIDFWFKNHCRSDAYIQSRSDAESGLRQRAKLEDFK